MPLQETSGAASYDAYGGGVAVVPTYIEDVFSTWLYTGNGSTQTITNGIDLAGKGGLVWLKARDYTQSHGLFDTARGENPYLSTDLTSGQFDFSNGVVYNSNGFTNKATSFFGGSRDGSGKNYVAWTFRKQPKFFDVVTYTGNGSGPQVIPHNLGSVPGFVVVKQVNATSLWFTSHRGNGSQRLMGELNATSQFYNDTNVLYDYGATSLTVKDGTAFLGSGNFSSNTNGVQYVAYVFAHNAGGFGLTGTDNVISCGSYTGNGSTTGPTVTLGYEPQYLLIKNASGATSWQLIDTMRGMPVGSLDAVLTTNQPYGESLLTYVAPTATGFQIVSGSSDVNTNGATYIYIAIRRGPMKTPTSGTSVFVPLQLPLNSGSSTVPVNAGLTTDMVFGSLQTNQSGGKYWASRLTGSDKLDSTFVYATQPGAYFWDNMVGVRQQETNFQPAWYFCKRAPGFFDEVCYTGTGTDNTQITHNLGVAPELIITKKRSSTGDWWTLCTADADRRVGRVNLTNAFTNSGIASIFGNGTSYVAPTASVFTLGSGSTSTNTSGATYVAYLFASCQGVSKCTAFTGTGALQTIDCGFTSGARFVLIKRTDSTGDWYVWDSSRGLSSSTDPYLLLNSTAAEVTSTNWVDTTSTGFQVTAASGNNVNINGASYIALAIS